MHPLTRWHPRNLPSHRLVLVFILLLALSGGGGRPVAVAADESDGCDPTEPIACLEVPEEVSGEEPRATGAPAAAAPLPPRRCPPIVVPQPVPAPAAAAPIPVPPGCSVQPVVAVVNRANLLYRQALLRLDGSILTAAWGGEALADLLGQIAVLRAAGRYGDPQLLSITLVELRVGPSTARVRTHEHWIYRERLRFSGRVVVEQEQWVQNIYDLHRRGGSWIVVRDVITFIAPPAPAPPRPLVSVHVTTDRTVYATGDSITAVISNDGSVTLWAAAGQYPCGPLTVERLGPAGQWEPVPAPAVPCPAIAQAFPPGQSSTYIVPAGLAPGVYRLAFRYSAEGAESGTAYSPFFVVQ